METKKQPRYIPQLTFAHIKKDIDKTIDASVQSICSKRDFIDQIFKNLETDEVLEAKKEFDESLEDLDSLLQDRVEELSLLSFSEQCEILHRIHNCDIAYLKILKIGFSPISKD